MRKLPILPLVLLTLLVAASCKQEHGVGDESLLDFKEREQQRLGQSSPSPSPPAEEAPQGPQQKQGVGQAPQQEQPQQQEPVIQISIRGDDAGSAFAPSVVRVTKGAKVTWVNNDSIARSVEADGGAFNSGPIPPGGSWTWTATRTGKHDYHDGTRPYAVASLEVVG